MRFALLRSTAPRKERMATKTARLLPREFFATRKTIPLQENLAPARKIRSISDFSRTFSDFGKLRLCVSISPSGDYPSKFLVLVGDGELAPSFGPSPLEDESSALGTHAGAKAESPVSFRSAGLVGALHGILLLNL